MHCLGDKQKEAEVVRLQPKKAPKYSKDLEVVNSGSLTASDKAYLKRRPQPGGSDTSLKPRTRTNV
jgi:hypothetical protein